MFINIVGIDGEGYFEELDTNYSCQSTELLKSALHSLQISGPGVLWGTPTWTNIFTTSKKSDSLGGWQKWAFLWYQQRHGTSSKISDNFKSYFSIGNTVLLHYKVKTLSAKLDDVSWHKHFGWEHTICSSKTWIYPLLANINKEVGFEKNSIFLAKCAFNVFIISLLPQLPIQYHTYFVLGEWSSYLKQLS